MGLTLRTDPQHPSGGYAILAGPDVSGLSTLSIENVFSSQFLGPDGQWGKLRHAFAVAPTPSDAAALSLGPEIVDHVPTDLLVALHDGGGTLLGRLVWPDSIVPRRDVNGGRASADGLRDAADARGLGTPKPPPEPIHIDLPKPDSILPPTPDTKPVVAKPNGGDGVLRRPWWLIPVWVVAALALGCGLYAWVYRSSPPIVSAPHLGPAQPPPADLARRCADTFDSKVAAAQDAPDNDRVKLADEAIEDSCGAQAFLAVDGTRWETNEPAAWLQARFYDPNETRPVFRAGHAADARAAFDYYARWAERSPRQAEALKTLCASDPGVVGDNAQRKRACAR